MDKKVLTEKIKKLENVSPLDLPQALIGAQGTGTCLKPRLSELCECKGVSGCSESIVESKNIKYTTKSKDILNIGQFLSA